MNTVSKKSATQIRVRYGETDQMGYVYYGNYAQYHEIGRTECMKEIGVNYRELESQNIMLPVVHYESRFLRPALYDDLLTIETHVAGLTEYLIIFETSIFNEEGKLLNRGTVKLCFVDANSRKRVQVPDNVKNQITPSV